ncbi:ABC transporter substrate-binding protein [Marinobacterium aestuariivivens]|uniref:ABC transporter substrate-binding protein n=1 Tax=Marinobacterium aestuariivivens TaxID=1698799 RepID=A0ABW1ZZB1_9GAMM
MLLLSPVVSAAQQQLIILTSFSEPVSQQFKSAFERQYPDIEVRFINKKTSAALSHLEKGMKPVPDLFMASAVDAFEWLTERGLLLPYQAATATTPPSLPYVSFAHSGYGLMWNDDYLQRYRLQAPVAWNDLLDPGFHGHIGMSSPTRSGTTHVLVETLLQQRGWDAGWAYWLELAGNLATVTARSFGVRQGY